MNIKRHNFITVFRAPDDGSGNGQGSQATAGAGKAEGEGSNETKPAEGTDNGLPKSREELEKLLQSEGDKRINGYLSGDKHRKVIDEAVKTALEEERRTARMTKEEKEREAEEKRVRELNDRDAKIAERERQLLVVDLLSAEKAPTKLRDFITAKDEDGMREQLKTLLSIIDEGVSARQQERLSQAAIDPKGQQGPQSGDAAIIAEYNSLVNKPTLNGVEQRRLNELTDKVREIKARK